MTESPIPDFTETELWLIKNTLKERYGEDVTVELADSELRLDPAVKTLTLCPTAYWRARGAQFVIFKTGENAYRCQFFYSANEQFGTGREVYDDLGQCVVTLLQVQSDHERDQAGIHPGSAGGSR